MLFEWKAVYSVNVAAIDTQHQGLIACMNRFYAAHEEKAYSKAVTQLKELLRLTTDHFRDEEAYMQRVQFKDFAEHAEHHKKLLDAVAKLAKEYITDPNPQVGERLAKFLKSWLSGHILGVDKKYAPPAKAVGAR
jgi:hemerythrin